MNSTYTRCELTLSPSPPPSPAIISSNYHETDTHSPEVELTPTSCHTINKRRSSIHCRSRTSPPLAPDRDTLLTAPLNPSSSNSTHNSTSGIPRRATSFSRCLTGHDDSKLSPASSKKTTPSSKQLLNSFGYRILPKNRGVSGEGAEPSSFDHAQTLPRVKRVNRPSSLKCAPSPQKLTNLASPSKVKRGSTSGSSGYGGDLSPLGTPLSPPQLADTPTSRIGPSKTSPSHEVLLTRVHDAIDYALQGCRPMSTPDVGVNLLECGRGSYYSSYLKENVVTDVHVYKASRARPLSAYDLRCTSMTSSSSSDGSDDVMIPSAITRHHTRRSKGQLISLRVLKLHNIT